MPQLKPVSLYHVSEAVLKGACVLQRRAKPPGLDSPAVSMRIRCIFPPALPRVSSACWNVLELCTPVLAAIRTTPVASSQEETRLPHMCQSISWLGILMQM